MELNHIRRLRRKTSVRLLHIDMKSNQDELGHHKMYDEEVFLFIRNDTSTTTFKKYRDMRNIVSVIIATEIKSLQDKNDISKAWQTNAEATHMIQKDESSLNLENLSMKAIN